MPGYGFGYARGQRTTGTRSNVSPEKVETVGALTRNSAGAGISISATSIASGDGGGHWTIANGQLFPSNAGDAADLNASPYDLVFSDGSTLRINIEPDTWDAATQAEWDFVATQSAAALAGKTIALRNSSPINLGIIGESGTPFRLANYEGASGNPCVVKGRFGESGAYTDYCQIDKIGAMRGAIGVRFEHLRTTPVAETKVNIISQASSISDNIVIHDCWITGEAGDPNGDYANSTNYPNLGIDLITTAGKSAVQGSITISECLLEWADTIAAIQVDKPDSAFTFEANECRHYYGDGVQAVAGATPQPFIARRNFIHSGVGRADDSANAHADSIRVQGSKTATTDFELVIEENVIIAGDSRGDSQGIFCDDMKSGGVDSGHFFTGTLSGNLIAVKDTLHGIDVGQAKNITIQHNTAISYGANQLFTPTITIGVPSGDITDGGGNVVRNNICDRFNIAGAAASENFEAGLNGSTISYDLLFDGPSFVPVSRSDAQTLFNPKVAAGAVFGMQTDAAPSIINSSISGTAQNGETLTATAQSAGIPAPVFSYQWYKNGSRIPSETAETIALEQGLMGLARGDTISCKITATNSVGTDTTEPATGYVAVPAQYLVQGSTAGRFTDTTNVPSGTSRITFAGTFYWPAGTISTGQKPFNILSTQCDLELVSNGQMRVTVEDSSFGKVLSLVNVPNLTIKADSWYDIVFDVNMTTNAATVTVNGTPYVIPFAVASTGTFQNNQRVGFLMISNGTAAIQPTVRAANLSVELDGSLRKAISNNPAAANADAWHGGGDFTGAA